MGRRREPDEVIAQWMEMRNKKGGERVQCCSQWDCIHAIRVTQAANAVEDGARARGLGIEHFRMYVRALYLRSAPGLKAGENRSKAAKQVRTYRHPAVVHSMCQRAFLWLLDIDSKTFRSIVPGDLLGDLRVARATRHGNESNLDAKKRRLKPTL